MDRDAAAGTPAYWRVAIVEDHLLQRRHTEQLLSAQDGLVVSYSCETVTQLMTWMETTTVRDRPHLVVLDLVVERGPSVDADHIRSLANSGSRILVLSAMAAPAQVREILRAGVHGIVGKRDTEDDILAAVWSVLGRRQWITPELAGVMAGDPSRPALSDQEERALVLYASGLTLDAVAEAIGVKPGTAKKYLERVKEKYASAGRPARTKLDLSREASRDGLLSNEG